MLLDHDVNILDTQYRMHPNISSYPNRWMYASQIKDGPNVLGADYKKPWHKPGLFPPYCVLNVSLTRESKPEENEALRYMGFSFPRHLSILSYVTCAVGSLLLFPVLIVSLVCLYVLRHDFQGQ